MISALVRFASFAGLVLCASAARAEYPTLWVLRNETSLPIVLQCKSDMNGAAVALPETTLAPQGQLVYDWGRGYYADGLGLNPGQWTCAVRATSPHFTPAGTFKTDWGEHIELAVSGAQIGRAHV